MNMIPAPLRALFSANSANGIHITGRSKEFLTIEKRSGSSIEMQAVPVNAGVRVACVLDGQRSSLKVDFPDQSSWLYEPGSEQVCSDNYKRLMKGLAKKPLPWFALGAAAVVSVFVLLMFVPADDVALAANVPMAAPQMGGDSAPKSSILDSGELAQVVAAPGILMRADGRPFYVFSDPNCPFCVELERSLMKMDPSLKPVLLPLGFKPGSRDLAAAALCSDNPAKAWREALVEGVKPAAAVCEKGLKQVDDNMTLFQQLRLSSTPTMISASGQVVVGSGDPERIKLVMAQ